MNGLGRARRRRRGTSAQLFWTGANHDPMVPIAPGVLVWERLSLSDGALACLVTSIGRA